MRNFSLVQKNVLSDFRPLKVEIYRRPVSTNGLKLSLSVSNNPKISRYYFDFAVGIQFQFSSYWFHQLQKQLDGCISPVKLHLLFWNFIIGKICKRGQQWVTALGKIDFLSKVKNCKAWLFFLNFETPYSDDYPGTWFDPEIADYNEIWESNIGLKIRSRSLIKQSFQFVRTWKPKRLRCPWIPIACSKVRNFPARRSSF